MDHRAIIVSLSVLAVGCAPHDLGRRVTPSAGEPMAPVGFERIAEMAQQVGTTPTPLQSGPHPGRLRDGKPWSGTFVWSSHKTAVIIEEYKNGQRDGLSVGYRSKNIKHWEGRYLKGDKDGVFRVWDAEGNLHSTEVYKNGVRIKQDE